MKAFLFLLLLANFFFVPEFKAQSTWIEHAVHPTMTGVQLTATGYNCIIHTRASSQYVFFFDTHSKAWTECDLGSQQNIKKVMAGRYVVFAYTDSLLVAYSSITSTFHVVKYSGNILQSALQSMQGYGCGELAAYIWTDENIFYVFDGLAGVWKSYNYGETTYASGGCSFWCGDNYVAGNFHRTYPHKHRNIVYSLVTGTFNKTETGGVYYATNNYDAMSGGFVSTFSLTPDTALLAGYSATTNQFYIVTEETPYAYVNIGSWNNTQLRKKNVYGYTVKRGTVEPREVTIRTFDTYRAAWFTHFFTYSGTELTGPSNYLTGGNTAFCAMSDKTANATFYVYSGKSGNYSIIQPDIANLNLTYCNAGEDLEIALDNRGHAWFFNSRTNFSQSVLYADDDFINYAVSADYASFCCYNSGSSIMNIVFYNSITDRISNVLASKEVSPRFKYSPYSYVFLPSESNQIIFYSSLHDSIMSITSDYGGTNGIYSANGGFSWVTNSNKPNSTLVFDAANMKLFEADATLQSSFVADSIIYFRKDSMVKAYDASIEKITSFHLGSLPGYSNNGGNIILVGNANLSRFYAYLKGSSEWKELIPEGNSMAAYVSKNTAVIVRNTKVYAFSPDGASGTNIESVTYPRDSIFLHNYPNPFSQNTTVIWKISKPGHVLLKVYDNMGREIRTLIDKNLPQGEHQVTFIAEALQKGVYFMKLQFNHRCISKKMIKL